MLESDSAFPEELEDHVSLPILCQGNCSILSPSLLGRAVLVLSNWLIFPHLPLVLLTERALSFGWL